MVSGWPKKELQEGIGKERMGMYEWEKQIQEIVDEIDQCIINHRDEAITLSLLSKRLGYSPFYMTRKFREISGMRLRDYIRRRRLAFGLKELRDTERDILDIALDYGFSSHEAFSRAFGRLYGISPSAYRKNPHPVVLCTKINPFDRYFLGLGEIGMMRSTDSVKIYFVTIPAHKFLHVKNYESNGYWDFWQKQEKIAGQDCNTICGLLDSIKGKLDDMGGSEANSGAGQIMGYINDPAGQPFCYGIPRAECYGVRLPADYKGEVPSQMLLMDVPEAEYVVFEHGPFDYEQENCSVEREMEEAKKGFDLETAGYRMDDTPGRVGYFYHDPNRFWKEIRPVRKV